MDLPYKLEFDEAALKMMDERMILKPTSYPSLTHTAKAARR